MVCNSDKIATRENHCFHFDLLSFRLASKSGKLKWSYFCASSCCRSTPDWSKPWRPSWPHTKTRADLSQFWNRANLAMKRQTLILLRWARAFPAASPWSPSTWRTKPETETTGKLNYKLGRSFAIVMVVVKYYRVTIWIPDSSEYQTILCPVF